MSVRLIDTTTLQHKLGERLARVITLSHGKVGLVLYDSGDIIAMSSATLLSGPEASEAVMLADRRLIRERSELNQWVPDAEPPAAPEPEPEDPYALEVPDFIPPVPVIDASPEERDALRSQRRDDQVRLIDDEKEEGWE